ncbi:LuxR C-terminal-related transcriptional regulator [Flavobacterium sp. NKUCC04_CG]|nr:LuxR C-terminal-related transcriptional regulator [Flavobacterium sp. NKUCC04_CG]
MSISNISPSFYEMHDLNPELLSINNILGGIHPEDIDFVVKAETFLAHFFSEKIGREKLLSYKISYSYRARLKDGNYVLMNHQALMLTMDDQGGYGKSLNINTCIDHLSNLNTYKISLIGLNGEPSFMNLSLDGGTRSVIEFSKREIDIIKLISNGLSNQEIADTLFISALTVKKHRNNILTKSDSKNTAQLIKNCVVQGLI